MTKKPFVLACSVLVFVGGFVVGNIVRAQSDSKRVFELRTYTAPEGKLGDLDKRFRDHTMRIFKKHGMENVGYWHPQDAPDSANTLIYIISHKSRDAAKASWAAFQADPDWQRVSTESQVNGRIVSKVVSVFMDPTDYSPIK
ncbi:MAG: NIPSNAP family protein [Acidobacteria bacterium 13_1_40CM_65_14]|nr:MAG: NIPSNAP family protein [Acidobacteria bacterium 13_1_40CM_65_14]OLC77175.1 MAG: NIPSNAP family protein [Acidobacteria bacterium 13_1_40CM_4_65_8]